MTTDSRTNGARRHGPLVLGLLALALSLGGLGCAPADEPSGRAVVVVSVLPQAWLVERLAGGHVDVTVMIPPGASPATHEPDLAQLRALENAALYVKVGHPHFPFEAAWLDRLLEGRSDLAVVGSAGEGEASEHDPHVWVSPANMGALSDQVSEALIALIPEQAAAIRANHASLRSEIADLDAKLQTIFATTRGKRFFVLHPAWGHLCRAYGFEQIAIQEENREPDPHRLATLIQQGRALGVDVVFSQPHFDPASAEVLSDALDARVETLDPLARDWPTNLLHVAERLAAEARG